VAEVNKGATSAVRNKEDLVGTFDVRRFPRQGHLDARWAPGDEVDQLALSNALKCFMNLRWTSTSGEEGGRKEGRRKKGI
jgi:hypothetical protein